MLIYEIVSIASAIVSSSIVGAFIIVGNQVKDLKSELSKSQTALAEQVKEFAKITAEASKANNTMGEKIIEFENKLLAQQERITMINQTSAKGSQWNSPRPNSM